MTESIEGMRDEDHAHLSPRQREKLAAERSRGAESVADAQRAADFNSRQQEGARARRSLDADEMRRQREGAAAQRAQLAAEKQEENARVNLEKEAKDAYENAYGVERVPDPAASATAAEIVRQRTEQAKERGLVPNGGYHGHPEVSEEQAAAAQANAEKEASDRYTANNYDVAGNYQGHSGEVQAARYDEMGGLIEEGSDAANAGGPVPEQTDNGQPEYVPEQTAQDFLAGVGDPDPKPRRRGRPPKGQQAVGDGPKSE